MGSVSDFFDVLEYDSAKSPSTTSGSKMMQEDSFLYTQQLVLASSDLEASVDALVSTLNERTAAWMIRSVLVQESAIERFNAILKRRIPALKSNLNGFEYEGTFVALDTFRTAKEALTLTPKQQWFPLSIWSQDISAVMEIAYKAAAAGRRHIWINSIGLCSAEFPINVQKDLLSQDELTSNVLVIEGNVQYQRVSLRNGVFTTIVTSFGSIFAN